MSSWFPSSFRERGIHHKGRQEFTTKTPRHEGNEQSSVRFLLFFLVSLCLRGSYPLSAKGDSPPRRQGTKGIRKAPSTSYYFFLASWWLLSGQEIKKLCGSLGRTCRRAKSRAIALPANWQGRANLATEADLVERHRSAFHDDFRRRRSDNGSVMGHGRSAVVHDAAAARATRRAAAATRRAGRTARAAAATRRARRAARATMMNDMVRAAAAAARRATAAAA